MTHRLIELPLRQNTDLLLVRRMVRQSAELLGFDPPAQTCLAAASFDLCFQALKPTGMAKVLLHIDDGAFLVTWTPLNVEGGVQQGVKQWRIARGLPQTALSNRSDVSWILQQLATAPPPDAFEELQRANAELLQALLTLTALQKQSAQPNASETSAA